VARRKSSNPKASRKPFLLKLVVWLVGLSLAFLAGYTYHSWKTISTPRTLHAPLYEEKVHRDVVIPKPTPPTIPSPPAPFPALPKVVIVIDDLGYHKQLGVEFIELEAPITFSFLPQAPYAKEMAVLAYQKGKETLIHLPMEPKTYPEADPGPGTLLVGMSSEEVQTILIKDLAEFPYVKGANNHMGSRFTENPEKMGLVLAVLKRRGLFFLDSITTPQSVVPAVASELGVKYIHRDLFLDNVVEKEAIRLQLHKVVEQARARGSAIVCGHPYPLTLQTLKEELPRLQKEVQLVTLAQLNR
jgi:uncharacterized protein